MIQATMDAQGYPPTVREIGACLGMSSPNAVQQHLRELERKGYLKRIEAKGRALTLKRASPRRSDTIPLLGKIS
jgi:repressor LexA